jgi:hypothetical protein
MHIQLAVSDHSSAAVIIGFAIRRSHSTRSPNVACADVIATEMPVGHTSAFSTFAKPCHLTLK